MAFWLKVAFCYGLLVERGSLSRRWGGGSVRTMDKRAVCILLECFLVQKETRKKNVRMLCVYSSEYFPILAQLFLKEDCTAVFGRTADESLHCFGMTQDTSCRF